MATPATKSLITTSDAFCEAKGLSRSRISTLVFNDGKALDRIAGGGDLNTRSYEKAMAWFAANWPEGVAWPEGVERPALAAADSLDAVPAEQGAAA
jgi:hypothetical protein